MAFVVRRPGARWEIRESFTTPDGPRSRTLATFTELTAAILDRAELKARRPIDRGAVINAAKRAGAPIAPPPADALAEALVRTLARGEALRPGLRKVLLEHLDPSRRTDDSFTLWIGATPEERGAALRDLLGLVDRLPTRPRRPLRSPRLSRAKR